MVDISTTRETFGLMGLTENDYLVYSAFLKHGEMSAAALARKISMDKSSAYRAADNLEKNSLLVKRVSKTETVYSAANPEILTELYSSKRSQIDILVEELKHQAGVYDRATYITVEKGIDALRYRMTESLDSKEKVIREKFSDKFRYFEDKKHVNFVINYAKTRTERGIKMLALEESDWKVDDRFGDVMMDGKKYFKEIRRLPANSVKTESNSLRIWDTTVNIISEDENREFIIVTIKDKFAVKLIKEMFDFMWNRSKPV